MSDAAVLCHTGVEVNYDEHLYAFFPEQRVSQVFDAMQIELHYLGYQVSYNVPAKVLYIKWS